MKGLGLDYDGTQVLLSRCETRLRTPIVFIPAEGSAYLKKTKMVKKVDVLIISVVVLNVLSFVEVHDGDVLERSRGVLASSNRHTLGERHSSF